MNKTFLFLTLTVMLFIITAPAFSLPSKTLNSMPVKERVKIDGRLEEDFYKNMVPVGDFVQFHPKNGEKPTLNTDVYCFYDRKNVYFAVKCYDPEPKKITADITPFGEFTRNDQVSVYIDAFMDKRNYKTFTVNPRGIKAGEQTVWDANAHITDYGWSAEFKIPFKSLRFPVKDIQSWGVNIMRYVFRLNEKSYWTNVARDKMNTFADTFGSLEGISGIKGGKNVEIYPYVGYRNSKAYGEVDDKFAYGVDVKYGITSNLTLDFTSSPDYSEVESDPFFYQTDPFEVNLQENRPFYNEGSEYLSTPIRLFYSRRIANPDLAVKVTGKEKGISMGALFAKNDMGSGNPDRYHGVFRLKKDVFDVSYIGMVFTDIEEKGDWNRNIGFDFSFNHKDIYSFDGMMAWAYNKGLERSGNGMYWFQAGRFVDSGLSLIAEYIRVEPNVVQRAGFLQKVDYQTLRFEGDYSFRWEGKWLEKLNLIGVAFTQKAITSGMNAEYFYKVGLDFTTRQQVSLYLSAIFGKNRAQVFDGDGELVWGQERFPTAMYAAELVYQGSTVMEFGVNGYFLRDFVYNDEFTEAVKGDTYELGLNSTFKINPQLQLKFDFGRTFYKSADDSIRFSGNLVSTSLKYLVTKRVSSFVKFQYDSYEKRFQYDFLVGYEPANVSKVYISLKNYSENRLRFFHPDIRSFAIKLSYLFRL